MNGVRPNHTPMTSSCPAILLAVLRTTWLDTFDIGADADRAARMVCVSVMVHSPDPRAHGARAGETPPRPETTASRPGSLRGRRSSGRVRANTATEAGAAMS